jgi:hypothetical protein
LVVSHLFLRCDDIEEFNHILKCCVTCQNRLSPSDVNVHVRTSSTEFKINFLLSCGDETDTLYPALNRSGSTRGQSSYSGKKI